MPAAPGHTPFTITLPDEVIETMMQLKASKMWGPNRAEIARALIQDALKRLAAEGVVRLVGVPPD